MSLWLFARPMATAFKSLVQLVQEAGYGVVVVRTTGDDDYVLAIAGRKRQGKLVGDTRKWRRDQGYQFVVKRRDERFLTTKPSHLVLPDGREIQILGTDT